MFDKYSPGSKPGTMKNSQGNGRDKDKELSDKLSRIQDSYVDAAIRSVRRKFSGRKNLGFEGWSRHKNLLIFYFII